MRSVLSVIYIIGIVSVIIVGGLLLLTVFPIPGLNLDARVVQSGSMEPAIKTGSVVFIRPAEQYNVNDIITFRRNPTETPTTHRIIEIDSQNSSIFTTKGDANSVQDMNKVNKKEIIGSVRFQIPYLGYAINFTRKPLGFLLLIIIPALIIGVDEVRKIIKEVKKNNKKETQKTEVNKKEKPTKTRKKVIDLINEKKF